MKSMLLALTLTLAACAAPGGYWDHPTADAAQKDRDARQCIYESQLATASAPSTFYLSQNVAQDIATGFRQVELQKSCVAAKGYYWVPQ